MRALSKPPAKELAAIAARAAAAGKKPTQAAILATYNRNQARANAQATPSDRSLAEAERRRVGSTVTKPTGSSDRRASTPRLREPLRPHPDREERGGSARPSPAAQRAAMQSAIKVGLRNALPNQATLDRLSRGSGIGREAAGWAQFFRGTPVSAYYAARGALGPTIGDQLVEFVYGRPALNALRQGMGDEARRLAQARDQRRPPNRRDE